MFKGLVIQELTNKGNDELVESVRKKMEETIPRVREIAVTYKVPSAAVQD